MINGSKRATLVSALLFSIICTLPTAVLATSFSINFDELNLGANVTDQYTGVTFQSGLTTYDSPGQIVDPSSSLKANSFTDGIYVLFDFPIFSFNVSIFEYVEYYEEEEDEYEEEEEEYEDSVYLVAFDRTLSELVFDVDNVVHSTDFWSTIAVSDFDGIWAVRLYGTKDFKIDNILIEDTAPVPEPSTVFLLGSGLVWLAWYGRKRKKA